MSVCGRALNSRVSKYPFANSCWYNYEIMVCFRGENFYSLGLNLLSVRPVEIDNKNAHIFFLCMSQYIRFLIPCSNSEPVTNSGENPSTPFEHGWKALE